MKEKTTKFYSLVGKVWKESRVLAQGKREVEVSTLMLANDKNNVIYHKVLSFLVFKLQVGSMCHIVLGQTNNF